MLNRTFVKAVSGTAALIFGSGLASVYALTEDDFTNTGVVLSAPTQFENNGTNNEGTVLVQPKGLSVTKTADASALNVPTQAGDLISYTITLDNLGLLGLSNIALADSIIAASDLSLSSGDVNSDAILDGNEIWVYTGSYAITQADIDTFGGGDGDIDNLVTVTSTELPPIDDVAEVPITQAPEFTVAKVVDKASISVPSVLSYTIDVVNTGNQSLTGIVASDILPNGTTGALIGPASDIGIVDAIDVGETWTYSVTYSVSQAEIDAGDVLTNSVSVIAAETGADAVEDTAETTIAKAPELLVAKQVDKATINAPGTLNYSIEIENAGNVTLTNLVLNDVMPDASAGALVGPINDTGTIGALDVGELWEYTTSFNADQSSVDAGVDLTNTINVTSDETGADPVSDTAVTSIVSEPAVAVTKSVDIAALSEPGTLTYTIVVENTGNVSLSNVTPVDTLPDGSPAVLVGPLSDVGLAGQLDVGEVWEYSTTYEVSQAEIDLGDSLVNAVEVTSDETGANIVGDTAQTTLSRNPSFTVEKTVDLLSVSEPQVLMYEITIDNTGNTTLTDVQLDDVLPDGSVAVLVGPLLDIGANSVLDVGEAWTFTGEYTVTQAEIDSGVTLSNAVTVSTAEAGSSSDTAETAISQAPSISIVKSASETDYTAANDEINYTFVVMNTGNVALSEVVVQDANVDAGSLSCESVIPFALQPSEQVECSAIRTVLPADVIITTITNQANVTANEPGGDALFVVSNTVTVPMLLLPPVATDDSFISPTSSVPVTLSGASDDTDANVDLDVTRVNITTANASDSDGDGDNDTLVVTGEGTWLVNNVTGEVTFTPLAGFTADPAPVTYNVVDRTGLVSNEATWTIEYPQTAPVAEDDTKQNLLVASPSNPTILNVLVDNGNGADSDPENDIDITTISFVHASAVDTDNDGDADTLVVPGEGVWVVDNATADVTFTPEAGFLSDPTPISYTVSDINGLVSNQAIITVDYPQTAPIANDDEKLDQPLTESVVLDVVANDTDPENNLDPTTVMIKDPETGDLLTIYTVAGEGEWNVDETTGSITFIPITGFIDDPTPINYVVSDTTGLQSNDALVTVTYEAPATLEGIVWLDSNRNGIVDDDEERKAGWTLKVYDSDGVLVATTVSDDTGFYRIEGLVPGAFTVEFFNESGVFMDSQTTDGVVQAGQVVNLPLPVDPGGVVYDSVTREPVAGVTLTLLNSSDIPVDESCLASNQQSQVTEDDGLYNFSLTVDADTSCLSGDTFRIAVADAPSTYHPNFSSIIRQAGADSCGDVTLGCAVSDVFESALTEASCTIDTIANTNACEIQAQPDAPTQSQDDLYFVEYIYESGSRSVVFNHLPIDARANDALILLSKLANTRSVSTGGVVEYTLIVENTNDVPTAEIDIVDNPPANFLLVEDSVRLVREGADGEFDTEDDVVQFLNIIGSDPIRFEALQFDPEEIIQIRYLLRVGVGVVAGDYTNKAIANSPSGIASNEVSATVAVVSDPVLQQATLVGKVFNDRDSDGTQDPANATGVALRSDHYGWNSLLLPSLPGRDTVNTDPSDLAVIVNMPISDNNAFMIVTDEGTRISVDHDGNLSEAHVGDKARGFTGQDIRVCTQYTVAVPTDQQGVTSLTADASDVLQIVVENYGINEEGIPGARLATVTGLLIETDAYGRYSIPDVDVGTTGIGQNFVLKVDPATLPQGSRFTTENPYVLRIINESLNKINFGVNVPETDPFISRVSHLCQQPSSAVEHRVVKVSLGSVFFDTDKYDVRADQRGIVLDIIKKLREYGGGEILIEAHTDSRGSSDYNIALAERRAATIRDVLKEQLGDQLMESVSVEVNPDAYEEQP